MLKIASFEELKLMELVTFTELELVVLIDLLVMIPFSRCCVFVMCLEWKHSLVRTIMLFRTFPVTQLT